MFRVKTGEITGLNKYGPVTTKNLVFFYQSTSEFGKIFIKELGLEFLKGDLSVLTYFKAFEVRVSN